MVHIYHGHVTAHVRMYEVRVGVLGLMLQCACLMYCKISVASYQLNHAVHTSCLRVKKQVILPMGLPVAVYSIRCIQGHKLINKLG